MYINNQVECMLLGYRRGWRIERVVWVGVALAVGPGYRERVKEEGTEKYGQQQSGRRLWFQLWYHWVL